MDVSSNIADLTEWMLSVPGPTWAAWFQAVGTLGGIFVAWKIGQEQWRQHLEKESLAERDSVKAVYVLISRSARLIRLAGEALEGPLPATPSYSSIRSIELIAAKLESFDLVKRPTPAVLRMSLAGANEIHKFLGDLKKAESSRALPSSSRMQWIASELERYGSALLEHYEINEENWSQD